MAVTIRGKIYYSIHEVAGVFECSTRTLKRYLDAGKIVGHKMGRTWYFTQEAIDDYLNGKEAAKDAK
jgi:excisionase family DNA binding protein|nr:MAG TPA: helix-turn-helix domain protein [Caudoviricetes sp.]